MCIEENKLISLQDIIFCMDSDVHTKFITTGCCHTFGKKCKCGGWMHYQAVYNGEYYKCEKCLREIRKTI